MKMRLERFVLLAVWIVALVAIAPEAQAAGTPITTCGQVVTTSAFLAHDLDCPGSHGIVVGAAGIKIDLRGLVVRGDQSIGHYGIYDLGYDGVTVANGILRNFNFGVGVLDGDKVSVSNVVASGNTATGIYIAGASAKIRSSIASGNDTGIEVHGATAAIQSSTTSGNESLYGILVEGASASIKSSNASGNHVGISISGASASIKSSTASGNDLWGVAVTGGSGSITASTVSGNGGDGIDFTGASARIQSSNASGNGGFGIFVDGDAAQIKGNRAYANGFAGGSNFVGLGIWATDYTTPPVGTNVAQGNDELAECTPSSLC